MKNISLAFPIIITFFISGCSLSTTQIHTPKKDISFYKTNKKYKNINISDALLTHYKKWEGVGYKYGGNDKNGIDCSFFVKDSFLYLNKTLPRTTYYQVRSGVPISKTKLQMGDLVFFITNKRGTRHVGIYLKDGDFMHVSTSRGVMISSLYNPYWKRHYWKARRVLTEN